MDFLSHRRDASCIFPLPDSQSMNMMPTSTSIEKDYFEQAHEQYHQLIKTLSAEDSQGWEHGADFSRHL